MVTNTDNHDEVNYGGDHLAASDPDDDVLGRQVGAEVQLLENALLDLVAKKCAAKMVRFDLKMGKWEKVVVSGVPIRQQPLAVQQINMRTMMMLMMTMMMITAITWSVKCDVHKIFPCKHFTANICLRSLSIL